MISGYLTEECRKVIIRPIEPAQTFYLNFKTHER